MYILSSNRKHNIGYSSFPTENHLFKEEKTQDVDLSVNTHNKGRVELPKRSAYEDWSQEERKEEVRRRFKQ